MINSSIRFTVAAGFAASIAALPSLAQSLTGNVGSAGVSKGEQSVEGRLGFDEDGNAASRIHYDNAFTDWYQLRLIGAFSKADGEDWDVSGLTLENWVQWSEEASDNSRFNGGLRFAYTFAQDDGPDEVGLRLTVTDKFAGDWEWRSNVKADTEAGDGSEGGVDLEVRGQISRALEVSALGTHDWRLGVEVFSELGNSRDIPGFNEQAHQIGPVVKVGWDNGVFIQSAVRVGITDGADDSMAKLFVGREF
ncbi:MAG: hypothetical protein RIB03_03770 [Henriciella sp.]|uniref:hypothetical protein n=1 Tax=Henriciella sp. TaxID=1968823 RepID=UPI0032ECD074